MAQLVKNVPATWETWVRSLGWEDLLENGKATHSSILAWKIPWTVESMGQQNFGHDWATFTYSVYKEHPYAVTQIQLCEHFITLHHSPLSISAFLFHIYIYIYEIVIYINLWQDFPGSPVVKNLLASAGDMGLIPGPGGFHTPQGN